MLSLAVRLKVTVVDLAYEATLLIVIEPVGLVVSFDVDVKVKVSVYELVVLVFYEPLYPKTLI